MMIRGVSVLTLIVLLLSCPAWSGIAQNQNFGLQNQNNVLLNTSGSGFLGNLQLTGLYNTQQATNPAGNGITEQTNAGTFIQGADASGEGGLFGVNQLGGAAGWQAQFQPNAYLPAQQVQDLDAFLGQEFYKEGGVGIVTGVQAYVGYQLQLNISPFYGASANLQTIGVVDAGAVSGGPDSTTVYNGTIGSDTSQGTNP